MANGPIGFIGDVEVVAESGETVGQAWVMLTRTLDDDDWSSDWSGYVEFDPSVDSERIEGRSVVLRCGRTLGDVLVHAAMSEEHNGRRRWLAHQANEVTP